MKIYRFLLAFLVIMPFLQSCQEDITDLEDPRDAITKKWRVTDNSGSVGAAGYDVVITKDANESTQVLLQNFHGLGTLDKLKATLAGLTLTIPSQKLDNQYTISGSGTISSNLDKITFNYSVKAGLDPAENFTANFGAVVTVKKKTVPVIAPLQ